MLKVKICGITRPADALAAAEEGADYIGLVFAPSPRRVDARAAREILANLPPAIEAVGVFRDQPFEEVRQTIRDTGLRIAQLHGAEPPHFGDDLDTAVFKTFDSFTPESLESLKRYKAFAYLLDVPKDAEPDVRIDPEWALAAKGHGRVIVSGRLTAQSVGPLVARVRPFAADVSRGVESSPGVKDRSMVRDFVQAARHAEREAAQVRMRAK